MAAATSTIGTKSGYTSLFDDGTNIEFAEKIGKFVTEVQSTKIKSGHTLEKLIYKEVDENSTYKVYKNKKFQELCELEPPYVIFHCKIDKEIYHQSGQVCNNKTKNEIDMVIHDGIRIIPVEMKSGCNFDTKKSPGEIQSLMATKIVLKSLYPDIDVEPAITCYDATCIGDIKIKTDLKEVALHTYEDIALKMGISNPVESRNRITKEHQEQAKINLSKLYSFIDEVNKYRETSSS